MQTTNSKGKQPLYNKIHCHFLVAVMLLWVMPTWASNAGEGAVGDSQSTSNQNTETSFLEKLKNILDAWLRTPVPEGKTGLAPEGKTAIRVPLLEATENKLTAGTYPLYLGWLAYGKTSIKSVGVQCGNKPLVSQGVVDEKDEVVLPSYQFVANDSCKVVFDPVPKVSNDNPLSFKVVSKYPTDNCKLVKEQPLLAICLVMRDNGWKLEAYQKVAPLASGNANANDVKERLKKGVHLPPK